MATCLRLATVLALLVAAQATTELLSAAKSNPVDAFKLWAKQHRRTYEEGSAEFNYRYDVWTQNLDYIVKHDSSKEEGNTMQLGLNGFADLTTEEFQDRYLSKRPFTDASTLGNSNSALEEDGDNELPESINWRAKGIMGPVKDQHVNGAPCGCCWAFATSGIVEATHALATGEVVSVSEQQLIDCDTQDWGCEGGEIRMGLDYIIYNKGIALESTYPYSAEDGVCNRTAQENKDVTIDGWAKLPKKNEKAVMRALLKRPVVTAICCGTFINEWHLYTGGVFNPGQCVEPQDHAIVIVGYGEEDGVPFWLIKNSWGEHWGDQGYLKLIRGTGGKDGPLGIFHLPTIVFKNSRNQHSLESAASQA